MNPLGIILLIGCVALTIYMVVSFIGELKIKTANKPPAEKNNKEK